MWSFRVGSIPAIATKRRKMIHRLKLFMISN
nr:MAG TPA: hypothetical protein [Caudoviricetes sp.]